TPFLLRHGRGHPGRLFCLGVFAFATVLQLSMSGVYHLLGEGAGRVVLQRLDHAAIFVLIAGTNTPLYGVLFRGPDRWLPLLFVLLGAGGHWWFVFRLADGLIPPRRGGAAAPGSRPGASQESPLKGAEDAG